MLTRSSTLAESLKIGTGQANAESPHTTVPLYMPLAAPLSRADATRCLDSDLRVDVAQGRAVPIAAAHGTMVQDGRHEPLQLVLFYNEDGYQTYNTVADEYEMAVLMDGHGRRYSGQSLLPRDEAVALWIAGFLNWNCEVPGLYQLRFAVVEEPTVGLKSGSSSAEGAQVATNQLSSDRSRDEVFRLACACWNKAATRRAVDGLRELLGDFPERAEALASPVVDFSDFWLDQVARAAFGLPDPEDGEIDFEFLLNEGKKALATQERSDAE